MTHLFNIVLLLLTLLSSMTESKAQDLENDSINYRKVDTLFFLSNKKYHKSYFLSFWQGKLYLQFEYTKYRYAGYSKFIQIEDKKDIQTIYYIIDLIKHRKETMKLSKLKKHEKRWYMKYRWIVIIDLKPYLYSLANYDWLPLAEPNIISEDKYYTTKGFWKNKKIYRKLMKIIKHQEQIYDKNSRVKN